MWKIQIENDNVEILCQIAELYVLLNNYQRALQYLEKALIICPQHINSLELTRTIKERQNDLNSVLEISTKLFEQNQTENLPLQNILIMMSKSNTLTLYMPMAKLKKQENL